MPSNGTAISDIFAIEQTAPSAPCQRIAVSPSRFRRNLGGYVLTSSVQEGTACSQTSITYY